MIKMEIFVRSVLGQFVRASKMMPKTVNGQKQNGKALRLPPSPSVWLIEKLGSCITYVLTPNQAVMSPTTSHPFLKESPLLTFSLTFYDTSISVLELS
jgi:hypothetical protein